MEQLLNNSTLTLIKKRGEFRQLLNNSTLTLIGEYGGGEWCKGAPAKMGVEGGAHLGGDQEAVGAGGLGGQSVEGQHHGTCQSVEAMRRVCADAVEHGRARIEGDAAGCRHGTSAVDDVDYVRRVLDFE
jgi:hypothetical protein